MSIIIYELLCNSIPKGRIDASRLCTAQTIIEEVCNHQRMDRQKVSILSIHLPILLPSMFCPGAFVQISNGFSVGGRFLSVLELMLPSLQYIEPHLTALQSVFPPRTDMSRSSQFETEKRDETFNAHEEPRDDCETSRPGKYSLIGKRTVKFVSASLDFQNGQSFSAAVKYQAGICTAHWPQKPCSTQKDDGPGRAPVGTGI